MSTPAELRRLDALVVGGVGVDDAVYLSEPLRSGIYTQAVPEQRSPAGSGATIAAALAGAGLAIALVGAVGTDQCADWLGQILSEAGVDCHLRFVDGPSPRSLVLVEPSGERTIIGLTPDLLEHAVPQSAAIVARSGTVVIPAWRNQFRGVLADAHDAGARTVVGLRALADDTVDADIAVGSARELGTVDPLSVIDRFGIIVVTQGDRGAYALTSVDRFRIPPFPTGPVDATGAGDAFLAGLVAGLAHGESLLDALQLGSAWGSAAVAQRGTIAPPFRCAEQLRQAKR